MSWWRLSVLISPELLPHTHPSSACLPITPPSPEGDPCLGLGGRVTSPLQPSCHSAIVEAGSPYFAGFLGRPEVMGAKGCSCKHCLGKRRHSRSMCPDLTILPTSGPGAPGLCSPILNALLPCKSFGIVEDQWMSPSSVTLCNLRPVNHSLWASASSFIKQKRGVSSNYPSNPELL